MLTNFKMKSAILFVIVLFGLHNLQAQFDQNTNGNFPVVTGVTPDQVNKMVETGNFIYIGCETQGVYRITKANWNMAGKDWAEWNTGLPAGNLKVLDMTVSTTSTVYIICNGTIYHRGQKAPSWIADDFYEETGFIPTAIVAVNNTIYAAGYDGISDLDEPILARILAGSVPATSTWELLSTSNSIFPQNRINGLNRAYVGPIGGHWDLHISSMGNGSESGSHTRGCGANGDAGSNNYTNNQLYMNCKSAAYAADATGRFTMYEIVTAYTGPFAYGRYLMRRDYPTLCNAGWTAVTPDLGASFQYVSDVVNCEGFDQLIYSFGPQFAPSSCHVWEIENPYDACGSQDQENTISGYTDLPNENVPDLMVDGDKLYVATTAHKIYRSNFNPCTPLRESDELNNLKSLAIYPNPVQENLYIELPASAGASAITIYNLKGDQVYQIQADDSGLTIDVSKFATGTYLITCVSDEIVTTKIFEVVR